MTATPEAPNTATATVAPEFDLQTRPGKWIDHWRPEDPAFWAAVGKPVARRNLTFSILAEHFGFSVWLLWSIVVVQLNTVGFDLTVSQQLWLTAVPSGVGAVLRIPYTFAVPTFGGRNWTVVSALLLIIPCSLLMWAVGHPEISYGWLLLIAATAGVGGGNFASSMANISFFYPEKEKGFALGLNAAGGNLGVAIVQKLVPWVVGIGGGVALYRAGLIYIPFAIVAAILAYVFMDNLTEAKADFRPTANATKHVHTWIMSFLYIGTFGSFIGYSAAFPTLLKAVFNRPDIALTWGFLGALVGSVARPFGGKLADRWGGARITLVSYGMMMVGALIALWSLETKSLPVFFASFMLLFVATGIGNGSTYRMIPAIFRGIAADHGDDPVTTLEFKRRAAGAIGIISAVGAFGGFCVPIVYAWSKDHYGNIKPALWTYVILFAVMATVTFVAYVRPGSKMGRLGV
jgi:NNP family nitrate/nitrite transporter-like MFS transporter